MRHRLFLAAFVLFLGCSGSPGDRTQHDDAGQAVDAGVTADSGPVSIDAGESVDSGTVVVDAGEPVDAGPVCDGSGAVGACYAHACPVTPLSLSANRDRLLTDLAKRKCTDTCTLWAALNQAERYIFLMDTAYLADPTSSIYPPGTGNKETALDHTVALYSINGPMAGQGVDLSGRGGQEYNRIYLGFDTLAECVMRDFAEANPSKATGANGWQKSDDPAGPHPPFTQREMIDWYRATYDLSSNGPQFHHWHQDSDFMQSGIDQRSGVCGVTDKSLTELTIAFDLFHNSDPLGNYAGRGGYGWQIVDQHDTVAADWGYMPTSCPMSQPVNTDQFGGGTYAGMGPVLTNGTCTTPMLGTCPMP